MYPLLCKKILSHRFLSVHDLTLSSNEAARIEEATREQGKSGLWLVMRNGRITSKFNIWRDTSSERFHQSKKTSLRFDGIWQAYDFVATTN